VERLIPLALICGAVTVVMVWLLLARVRRQLETGLELVPVQRRSVVLVLRTQEELGGEAVRRAAGFERRATDERRSRTDALQP
jgi:hypothetical protein